MNRTETGKVSRTTILDRRIFLCRIEWKLKGSDEEVKSDKVKTKRSRRVHRTKEGSEKGRSLFLPLVRDRKQTENRCLHGYCLSEELGKLRPCLPHQRFKEI